MGRYVLRLEEIDRAQRAIAGGKGAQLGELTRIEGIHVPPAFCVTTDAFDQVLAPAQPFQACLARLTRADAGDAAAIRTLSAEIRAAIEAVPLPGELTTAIAEALARLGEEAAYAVRSSATAEDLATASFAGQQDTSLNVIGLPAILAHISRCWASLFTERAVTYRKRNGFDDRKVHMAVIVQRMVFAEVAGVLFTADPITSSRKVASVEASFGLGEALVSGRVNPDVYKVSAGAIVARTVSAKECAIVPAASGGTIEHAIAPALQREPALPDARVAEIVALGRAIEAHFGEPQDVEWCLAEGVFHIVQSRAITTLFPIPSATDGANHVYVSVGHAQMMTDAMKPLGLSLWQLTTARRMCEAGGRLFVDVTAGLSSPTSRAALLDVFGRGDPLIRDALQTVLDRGDFVPSFPDPPSGGAPPAGAPAAIPTDRAVVAELIARNQASVAALKRNIQAKSGPALFDFILEDIKELKRLLFDPRSHQAIMAGMEAAWWLNDHLALWLSEKNAVDVLTQSVADNVTSEMGLALLDVADAIRPHSAVVELLSKVGQGDAFLEELSVLEGGPEARAAILAFLDRYGMRCAGEIDVTRPRWGEQPRALVPMVLGNVRNFEAGESARRFEQGQRAASTKAEELLSRLRALPDGAAKAEEAKEMIDRVRTFAGYREYPKYGMVCRYFAYKQALLAEARRLLEAGVLRAEDDIFYLTFAELYDVARSHEGPSALIAERRDAFRSYEALTPPRVLTSDGECLSGSHRRPDVPPNALVGLPAAGGTVEGRARVVLDPALAQLDAGDILVTRYTDPSWTPVFIVIAGLVTEVGGMMTHGSVIAREYGLPAVVAVEQATRRIRDGQRIRVHGTDGYVEILG